MLLKSVTVKHYRSIRHETLHFESGMLTTLVGSNGAGKSAFLHAIRSFYEGIHPEASDYYNLDVETPIEIAITYDLTSSTELEQFALYEHDGELTVRLEAQWNGDNHTAGRSEVKYFGERREHAEFRKIRELGTAAERLRAIRELVRRDESAYDFEIESAWGRMDDILKAWEIEHPEECSYVPDDGDFFEPPASGTGPLAGMTDLVFVPAVRDASDEAAESGGSALERLSRVLIVAPSEAESVQRLRQDFQKQYEAIIGTVAQERLPALQQAMQETLEAYSPGVEVTLDWVGAEVQLKPPHTSVQVVDDGFSGDISRKGHGLQRLFLVSLLQAASLVNSAVSDQGPAEQEAGQQVDETRHLVLAIEEPELFQHPMQARRFFRTITNLASSGVGPTSVQVIVCTHSPLFVDPVYFDGIRLVYKEPVGGGLPGVSRVRQVALDDVARRVNSVFDRERYALERFRSGLHGVFETQVAEGFFSRFVVLVEGREDRAILQAALEDRDLDIDGLGVALVACGGKTNLDRPYTIFSMMGIDTYLVWDGDRDTDARSRGETEIWNKALQRLVGINDPDGFPETTVETRFTVFSTTMQDQVRSEIGEAAYDDVFNEVAGKLGWTQPSKAEKSQLVLRQTIQTLHEQGRRSDALDRLADAITEAATRQR